MIVLLLKVTLLCAAALVIQGLLRGSSAAMRHLICALALLSAALMPLTLLVTRPVEALRIPFAIEVSTTALSAAIPSPFRPASLLPILWALGALLILTRLVVGHRRVSRIRSAALPVDYHNAIPVLKASVPVPIAVGLVSPAILLPPNADAWSEDHRNAALCHEAAHITRKDLWTNTLAHIVCALYWFHPLVWSVARKLREEQELACDDAAIIAGTAPNLYAEALVAAARLSRSFTPPMIGCPMITHKTLQNRIARLIDTTLPRTSSTSTLRRVSLASGLAVICVALLNAGPQAALSPEVATPENAYRVGAGVSAPSVISRSDPEYTEEAKAQHIEGTVLMSVVVGVDGKAHHINILRPLDPGLDVEAVEAVQKWVFKPGTKDGQPVDVRAQIEINFRLM